MFSLFFRVAVWGALCLQPDDQQCSERLWCPSATSSQMGELKKAKERLAKELIRKQIVED